MTTKKYLQTSDTLLTNGKYYVIGEVEDVGQRIYAPYYWLEDLPALPDDADSKPYRLDAWQHWQDWSVDAQAERAQAAENEAQKKIASAQEAQAQAEADAKSAKQQALQTMLAAATTMPDSDVDADAEAEPATNSTDAATDPEPADEPEEAK